MAAMASPRDTPPSAPLAPRQPPPDPAALRELAEWDAALAREVPASRLTQAQRNAVWRHVKANAPERVAFLNDPQVQQLIRECGAAPLFPPELIRAALAEAEKVTQ